MQLLSSLFTGSTSKEASVEATGDSKSNPSTPQLGGFHFVFSQYSFAADEPGPSAPPLALAEQASLDTDALTGHLLPLRQTNDLPLTSSTELLDGLEDVLADMTGTLESIMTLEQNVPTGETGPVTQFLIEEMGFTEAEAADVMVTIDSWLSAPPEVAMTPESLASFGPEALALVGEIEKSLGSLNDELNQWFDKIVEFASDESGGSYGDNASQFSSWTGQQSMSGLQDTSVRQRSMLDALQQWSQVATEGEGRLSQVVASIAERVQLSLNSSASAGLPSTLDQSRPETLLLGGDKLVPDKVVPTADILFSQLLQRGNGQSDAGQESSMLTRLTSFAANSAENSGLTPFSGQPVLDKADAVTAVIQRSLQQPMLASEAGRQLGERLALMVKGDVQHATIRLDPPELGKMDVRVTVQNDQTQVQIIVQNPQVREALESQSVRLREFLEQQGLSLANLDIRDGSSGEQQAGDGSSESSGNARSTAVDGDEETAGEPDLATRWEQGLVDHFV